MPHLYLGCRLRLNWYRLWDPVWVSSFGAWTLEAFVALSGVLRGRGARVFFRGLPLPLLTEGAVGGLGSDARGGSAEGEDGRELGALVSLA